MKKIHYIIMLAILLPLSCMKSYGVVAYPYPFQYTQPDGSIVTIQLKGDEKVHWAVTTDGYSLLRNAQDGWEYATHNTKGDLVCSGILAHEPVSRSIAETVFLQGIQTNLLYSPVQIDVLKTIWEASQPAQSNKSMNKVFTPMGSKNLVLILIGYTDKPMTFVQADFNGLMNQVGYNLNGAVGSVKDFFMETSYNQFDITTTVAGPYTASHNLSYYGGNDINGDDTNARALITEAVTLANPDVNYANFDNDNDGTVDGVYVVYAGYGEAGGGPSYSIWPHASSITPLTFDGKTIAKYSCSNELQGGSGSNLTTIGVICHEFGHVCGAPDYYDTDYATGGQYTGTGSWDLMAGGSWNGTPGGNRPPHMNPLDKVRFHWVTETILSSDVSLTINDIRTDPVVYRYNTTTPNEYFLFENCQQTGFNTNVPGHGLLVFHYSGDVFSSNGNKTSPQGMYPVCANATANPPTTYGSINSAGCTFPGSGNKTSFTDATTPNALSLAGNNTNSALLNIAENTSTKIITLCFKSCPAINPILNFTATAANASQIDLSWTNNPANNDVIIAYNTTNAFGTLTDGATYNVNDLLSGGGTIIFKGSASSFDHTGLTASSPYYYQIWALNSTPAYSAFSAANSQTLCNSVTALPFIEGFEGGVIPNCWTQESVIGTNPWSIQTSGINGHPSGPHSGTNIARCNVLIQNAGYVTKLVSPPMDLSGITTPALKFWHTQDFWGNQDMLKVYYRTSALSAWNVLATYNTSIPGWTMESIDLPNPSSTYYIAFEAIVNAGYGVCLDDIMVSAPMADFSASGNLSCTGSLTVDFTDNSNGPNGSWAWDIDNNGTTDYTSQNPTHTYSNPGLYSVKLSINSGLASITKENLILVMSNAPTANTGCTLTANSNSGNGYGIGISRFALGNIDYTTSGSDGYFQNYACAKWTPLELNTVYNITIRTGTANNEGAKVYIDYNDNGTFDTGEAVVSFPANKDGIRTLAFTTPTSGVVLNKGLRLRVLSKFGSIPSTACDLSTYGQAEDYTVYFNVITNSITTGTINSPLCQGTAINVPYTINGTYNLGNVYTAQLSDALGSFASPVAIGTLTATSAGTISAIIPLSTAYGTGYKIRVISSNPAITGSANAANIAINSNPVPVISGTLAFCSGSSTSLDAGSYSSYLWSTAATTQTIPITTAGTFTVTVTNGNGCSAASAPATTIVNSLPTPSIIGTLAFCSGNSTTLDAGVYSGYNWSTTASTQTILVNSAGTYAVTVTDGNGCSAASAPVTAVVNSLPTPTISGTLSFCLGGSTTLDAGSYTSYLWSTAETIQTIPVNTAGTFTVTVTNGNGCSAASLPVTTIVNPLVTPTFIQLEPYLQGSTPGALQLTSLNGITGTWSPAIINTAASGSHVYTFTPNAGQCANPTTMTILIVSNNPLLGISHDIGTTVLAFWQPVVGAGIYGFQYRPYGSSAAFVGVGSIANYVKVTNLTPGQHYECRVKAYLPSGAPLPDYQYGEFTPTICDYIKDYDMGSTLKISWDEYSPWASSYTFQYKKKVGGTSWINNACYMPYCKITTEPGVTYVCQLVVYKGGSLWGTAYQGEFTADSYSSSIINNTGTSLDLTWTDFNLNDPSSPWVVDQYLRYRAAGSSDPWIQKTIAGGLFTAHLTGLTPNTNYEYQVSVYLPVFWGSTPLGFFNTNTNKGMNVNVVVNNFNIYPNPFIDKVNMEIFTEMETTVNWKIYDMTGKVVLSGSENINSGYNTLNIEGKNLPQGVYMLNAIMNDKMQCFRIFKQ